MRIGLLADIHEAVPALEEAIRRLEAAGVDRMLFLGDVLEVGAELDPAVALLIAAGADGVWGNHDFGMAQAPEEERYDRYAQSTRDYMGRLHPSLIIGDCHFSHVQPSLDPFDPADLWYYKEQPPEWPEAERLACFAAVPQRLLFVGHYHKWSVLTPDGSVSWDGRTVFRFDEDERYFVAVHAVFDGWCGLLDTDADTLEPIELDIYKGTH